MKLQELKATTYFVLRISDYCPDAGTVPDLSHIETVFLRLVTDLKLSVDEADVTAGSTTATWTLQHPSPQEGYGKSVLISSTSAAALGCRQGLGTSQA